MLNGQDVCVHTVYNVSLCTDGMNSVGFIRNTSGVLTDASELQHTLQISVSLKCVPPHLPDLYTEMMIHTKFEWLFKKPV